jgi:ATP-dependent Clp protease ATP-binding subunit ClpX
MDEITFYGIQFEKEKVSHIPKDTLAAICRLLFLSIEFPADLIKETVHRLEFDRSMDHQILLYNLQQHLRNYQELIKRVGHKPKALQKLEVWCNMFTVPSADALSELSMMYRMDADALAKLLEDAKSQRIKGPRDIKKLLDVDVVGQEMAKRSLSFAFYLHLLRTNMVKPAAHRITRLPRLDADRELPRPIMVLIGPTGSGKTFIVSQLCKAFDIPYQRIDCASLVASGYVGNNLNHALYQLLSSTDFNIEKASGALLYFDEFDKISESQTGHKGSVGGIELQQEFLSLIEHDEKVVQAPRTSIKEESFTLPLKNLTFIFSGSFAGMEPSIAKRLNKDQHRIRGYGNNTGQAEESFEALLHATHQDLMDFGIIPELAGRVNFIVPLHKLRRDDLIAILKTSGKSPLRQYQNFFYIHYNELLIDDEVYELMADKILSLNTGARGIQTVLHTLLNDLLYECPDVDFKTYHITEDYFRSKFPTP